MALRKTNPKKRVLFKIILISIPFWCMLMLSGCFSTSSIEVRDRSFVQAIGIGGEDTPTVALSIFAGKDEEPDIYTGKGTTIFEAIADAECSQQKNLFIGHIELIALDEGNIRGHLESLLTNNHISPGCITFFSQENPQEVFKSENSRDLLDRISINSKNGVISQRSISYVLEDLLGMDNAAAIPVYDGEALRMGIIDNDSVITILSEEEAQGLSWLSGTINTHTMPVETDSDTIINIRISNASARVDTVVEDGKIASVFQITFSASVLEKNYEIEDIKGLAEDKIKALCRSAVLRTASELGVDVFNIEKSIKAADFNFYSQNKENAEQLLKSINFEFDVKLIK